MASVKGDRDVKRGPVRSGHVRVNEQVPKLSFDVCVASPDNRSAVKEFIVFCFGIHEQEVTHVQYLQVEFELTQTVMKQLAFYPCLVAAHVSQLKPRHSYLAL